MYGMSITIITSTSVCSVVLKEFFESLCIWVGSHRISLQLGAILLIIISILNCTLIEHILYNTLYFPLLQCLMFVIKFLDFPFSINDINQFASDIFL